MFINLRMWSLNLTGQCEMDEAITVRVSAVTQYIGHSTSVSKG